MMIKKIQQIYDAIVLDRPVFTLLVLLTVAIISGWQAQHFELDASADSLTLEQDSDLEYFRTISGRYATQEALFVAYKPQRDLLEKSQMAHIATLRDALANITGIDQVTSLLDVPLLRSPPVALTELADNLRTLESADVDLVAAREELINSPIYRNLLVSPDFSTTALQLDLAVDTRYHHLLEARNQLRVTRDTVGLSPSQQFELTEATELFRAYNSDFNLRRHQLIQQVRDVLANHNDQAELFLGGVPMIADDMITYVGNDIVTFGAGVAIFIIISLAVLFRRIRFVILPLMTCGFTVLVMVGLLGFLRWPATVISSNFVSLLLILTMSMTLHLIVRYRQTLAGQPTLSQRDLVREAVHTLARPCLFATLTTIVAFISLLVSGIRPVIDFGWMMTIGLVIAYSSTFLVFPATLVLLPASQADIDPLSGPSFSAQLGEFTERHGGSILVTSLLLAVFTISGISQLAVENSFINYFSDKTEIHQGMLLIDQKLGGTTPLDVVFKLNDASAEQDSSEDDLWGDGTDSGTSSDDDLWEDEDDGFWEDESGVSEALVGTSNSDDRHWFTRDRMAQIRAVHDYLDDLPETGKVMSMRSMMELAEQFTDGEPLGDLELALLYTRIPAEFRSLVIDPYISVENNEARISMRLVDSDPNLKRNELIERIRTDLVEKVGLQPDQFQLTNMMVLYNNMLQSLFQSQILTLGAVFIGIMAMFLWLFRSITLAIIAIIPNLLSACFVLGVMGWAGIPLDMMTITIAAIAIGIAVDNTIHYIERFTSEFRVDQHYIDTMKRCHNSIGKSMFYTSLTIIVGFSILVLSNFIPTIYFGVLTSLAMLIAILGALLLLPRLILLTRPFGPEAAAKTDG
ncbi:MAG: MMPL family transporter [Immundisolibacteraceae bacterium]|nr:MMPL family transporter [Immundisolibacteraceae bacterium]